MGAYAVSGAGALTNNQTLIYTVLPASPTTRLRLFEFLLGCSDTPADQASSYELIRITDENATPGGTALTPEPLDEGDPAAASNGVALPTGQPTKGNVILLTAVNQRATFRWVASPRKEFVCPAAEDNGFGIEPETPTSAFVADATLMYDE